MLSGGVLSGCVLSGGGGCVLSGGVCFPGGVLGVYPSIPVNRKTDACENITLPQLRCGR